MLDAQSPRLNPKYVQTSLATWSCFDVFHILPETSLFRPHKVSLPCRLCTIPMCCNAVHADTRAMACIFMPFVQLSVMEVISAALTPSGPPICTAIHPHVKESKMLQLIHIGHASAGLMHAWLLQARPFLMHPQMCSAMLLVVANPLAIDVPHNWSSVLHACTTRWCG